MELSPTHADWLVSNTNSCIAVALFHPSQSHSRSVSLQRDVKYVIHTPRSVSSSPPHVWAQGLIAPFQAVAEVLWHRPKLIKERLSTSAEVRMSSLEAQPAFGHVPLFHSAARLLIEASESGKLVHLPPVPQLRSSMFRYGGMG